MSWFDIIATIFLAGFICIMLIWNESKTFKVWKRWIKEQPSNWLAQLKNLSGLRIFYFGFATIIISIFLYSLWLFLPEFLEKRNDPTTTFNDLAISVFAIFSGIGAVFAFYTSIVRTETAEQGLITDRINKAVEGIGKNDEGGDPIIEVRLGALYALERIAQDSIRDHIQIMEILCAYIRYNSPKINTADQTKPLREDIQIAVAIIGRRGRWPEGKKYLQKEYDQEYRLDLHKCDLHGARLNEANLNNARLTSTNLRIAQLMNAKLNGAKLSNAELDYANLKNANMRAASINRASLRSVNLTNAKLNGASLMGAKLNNARLINADFENTKILNIDMSGVNIGETKMTYVRIKNAFAYKGNFTNCPTLTKNHLNKIFCGIDVKIPRRFNSRPKHWPKTKLDKDEFTKARRKWRRTQK